VPTKLHGCVQSVDCAAACNGGVDQWLYCAVFACASDDDCGPFDAGHCVVVPGATEGVCGGLATSSPCADAGDCSAAQRCVAVKADGTRACIDLISNYVGPCNQDADCAAGHCALQGSSFLGLCTDGGVSSACFSESDCASGLHCRHAVGHRPGSCSDGSDNASCDQDADCQVGICAHSAVCSSGKLDDECDENADCLSGFCAYGFTCSDGAVGAHCGHDDECASGRCTDGLCD
jgi:hypothetical protein